MVDFLIVGSGLFGATFAYLARKNNKSCIIIEKRPHIGGNLYCEEKEGINIHKYGAHIFHTSNKEIWDFVNSFVEFNRYINSPIANYNGTLYNLPFNMNTFHQIWKVKTPEEAKAKIEEQRKEGEKYLQKLGITEPRNLEEQAISLVGIDIYKILIKGYTEKQWGRPCHELPPFIIKRIPVRFTYDNNYFNDKYQGIPIGGYNNLITRLLGDTEVICNCDFFKNKNKWEEVARTIVYTGKIDEYFDYRYGKLEYRTVNFEEEYLDTPNYQGVAVVNFTEKDIPYTRIIEHKHFEMFDNDIYRNPKTIISREYSIEWNETLEPYYPINNEKNNARYEKYKELADKESRVVFGGRLAEYKYYDMADVIERAFILYNKLITSNI